MVKKIAPNITRAILSNFSRVISSMLSLLFVSLPGPVGLPGPGNKNVGEDAAIAGERLCRALDFTLRWALIILESAFASTVQFTCRQIPEPFPSNVRDPADNNDPHK